eukprot:13971024-Alexandrium_andersonii.AAC.1
MLSRGRGVSREDPRGTLTKAVRKRLQAAWQRLKGADLRDISELRRARTAAEQFVTCSFQTTV